MSLQSVRQFFAEHAPDIDIIELNQSTATVALAAAAHNVEPGQIAKTLSLKIKNDVVLVVAKGDARLDNKKLKSTFGAKARMLSSDEVVTLPAIRLAVSVRSGWKTRWLFIVMFH
jgi:prolyl-tRNA editing enzyme YbaK/EbsC (Cys-tRNA(Pro) deacylase)